jgi:uncharacterized phage infection (PIP) family protein YhgE
MKATNLRALLVGASIAATAAWLATPVALAADAKAQQPSPKLAKPLHDAQEDLKAKKYPDAIAKIKEADAMAGKTAFDQHVINNLAGNAYINTQNYPEASKAFEAELDDGFLAESEKPQLIRAVAEMNYQLKNYDKVVDYGNRAVKGGFADERMNTLLGQSYYLKGDYKNTLKFVDAQIDKTIKAGDTPKKETLLLAYSSCQKLADDACQTKSMEHLVQYYPAPDYWSQLLFALRQQSGNNDADTLQTYRLMSEVDVMKTPSDYNEMAQLALEAGSPGEAQSTLQKAFQKNIFADKLTADRNQRLLDNAKKAATTDQATLPRLEKEADAAPTGAKNVGVGLAYLGYGQYDKAADEINKGLTKGGVKDEAQARLLLGIAQLKSGHKDDALKSFKSVKGDPTLERLANLWSLHAKAA